MVRISCCLAFVLALQDLLLAGESLPTAPPAKSRGATWSPLRATPASATAPSEIRTTASRNLQGRKQLEALLQGAANLNYDGRETVTVKEVLDDLHRQHQLSIRFDTPTLTSLFGSTETLTTSTQNEPLSAVIAEQPPSIGALYSAGPTRRVNLLPATESAPQEPPAKIADKPASGATAKESAVAAETKPTATDRIELAPGEVIDVDETIVENPLEDLLDAEINVERIDFKHVSIATVLRHALDSLPAAEAMSEAGSGMPIKMTHAATIDYLVEDDGVLITTRLNALTVKETRVYSLKNLKDITPDQLAKVVRQSIRPWSWRSQINDLGDQLKSAMPTQVPAEITSLMSTGMQLFAGASGIPVTYSACPDGECHPMALPANASPDQPAAAPASAQSPYPTTPYAPSTISVPGVISVGPAQPNGATPHSVTAPATMQPDAAATTLALSTLVNALEVFAHAALSGLEMMHHADPPTGTIQTLPGKLIITQSQAAHREIADLIKQLEDK